MESRVLKGVIASKMEVIVGTIIALLFLAFAISFKYAEGPRWVCISFVLLGAFYIVRGLEWGKLVSLYRTYEVMLSNSPSGSIDALASATKKPVSDVKKSLKMMIKRGMAGSMVIDEGTNCIVGSFSPKLNFSADSSALETASTDPADSTPAVPHPSQETKDNSVVVVCPSCGAKNSMARNAAALCGHCGAKIASN